MRLTIILAAFAAFNAFGQTQAAKPASPPAKVETPAAAPKLDSTAKLWRLAAKAEGLQAQIDKSDLGKQLAETNAAIQAEQQRLSGLCSAVNGWQLGVQQDAKADNVGDVVCTKIPPKTDAKPESTKEK